MSRKDYEAIAAVIDLARDEYGMEGAVVLIANRLAGYFERENPDFNRARFMQACGFEVR